MQRPAALICLTLALAGQPLRQAEAASDYARMLSHLLAPGGAIEVPDGGVGDDSGVATLKVGTCHAAAPAWSPAGDPRGALGGLTLFLNLAPPAPNPILSGRQSEAGAWLPLGGSRRHAWLQSFLF